MSPDNHFRKEVVMETLAISGKERRRLEVRIRVKAGEVSLAKGAELLGLSYRQAKRAWARYRDLGDAGLVHGLRQGGWTTPLRSLRSLRSAVQPYCDPTNTKGTWFKHAVTPPSCKSPLTGYI
jgi:hypothetical protein